MYDFSENYDVMPATEGVGDFFTAVLNKIKAAGEKIKEWANKVALKIRRMTGSTTAKESRADSKAVDKKIDEIGKNIAEILEQCSTCIDELYKAYAKVGKYDKINKRQFDKDEDSDVYKFEKDDTDPKSRPKYTSIENSMKAKNGMDRLSDDAKKDSSLMKEWSASKQRIGTVFVAIKGAAEKVSTDLKSLSSYGPLTLSSTTVGYAKLRLIFSANGTFGAAWKKVKIAAEWSTGEIKASLNKVVSLYDVGIRATDAFGRRLATGFVREDNGKKITDKSEMNMVKTIGKGVGKLWAEDKTDRNIATRRDDVNFAKIQAGKESALLDRLYQMAYEDAMEDIETAQLAMEAFDEVPGAYEFVEEPELTFDPEYDFC